ADSSLESGCPVGPLIFHQPIELKLKALGDKLERQPLVLWQPAGACRGLFPASSYCFSFRPGAAPCCSEENEVEWRRHLGEHVTATVWSSEVSVHSICPGNRSFDLGMKSHLSKATSICKWKLQ
ncbi:hypothetical protein AMECASPLE_007078, partial [Ameca splendens]